MMDVLSTRLADIASIYTADTILIVGKGPSVDQIDPRILERSLTIALNDAESIHEADITVFHGEWVKRSLAANGWRSRLYVSPFETLGPGINSVAVPYVPLTQDTADLIMQRFMTDTVVIEDILFLTALKLARQIATLRGRKQTVYMVGFDFSPELGYSASIRHDHSETTLDEKAARISIQQFFLMNALYFLKDSSLDVRHVGSRAFSAMTPTALNILMLGDPSADERDGTGKVSVVAELTTNHFGDRRRLETMIRAAKLAGANYVKLQKRDVETFYSREQLQSPYVSPFGTTFGDYRRQLELDHDDFAFVDDLCRKLRLEWFASLLDQKSFQFMAEHSPRMVKLPSTISEHRDYLEYVAGNYTGAVVLSTGMTDEAYEDFVMETFTKCESLYLMQANSAYPTPPEDCGIGIVRHYRDLALNNPRIIPAYSSHDHGTKGSVLAVAAGAMMIEKHVKMGNTEWAHFDAVALDLETPAFKDYVAAIREAEKIVGDDRKVIRASEHHKYWRQPSRD